MNKNIKKMLLVAMFLALGVIMPSVFHAFGAISGQIFLPMHIPALLAGFVCGPVYGLIAGFFMPYLSSFTTGMPVLFPMAVTMSFELGVYALVSGFLYNTKKKNVYLSLLVAMIIGRITVGVANAIILSAAGNIYSLSAFINASFVVALPGILIQLILIPLLVFLLKDQIKKI